MPTRSKTIEKYNLIHGFMDKGFRQIEISIITNINYKTVSRYARMSSPPKISMYKYKYGDRPCQKSDSYNNVRNLALEKLGNKCIRCGFSDKRALQIDHINGDGAEYRRKGYTGYKVYLDVLNGTSIYQLLCANCNSIKRYENKEFKSRYAK